MSDKSNIIGTCLNMCPRKERIMREREGLLHKFEWADATPSSIVSFPIKNTKSTNYQARNTVKKIGDISKVVKSFSRSAAGLDKTKLDSLRPAPVLEATVEYLYKNVLTSKTEAFTTVYDFIFDRLRSVRQDLVIQRITDASAIRILESIVRFHVYSGYRCRHEPVTKFDPHINRKHQSDNLKRLLWLYEINDYWGISRNEFETLNLIVFPDSTEVFNRAIKISSHNNFKHDKLFNYAVEMFLCYQFNNYVNYFIFLQALSPLLASAAFEHAREFRGRAFKTISMAFGVSTCKFSVCKLQSILLYPTINQVEKDLISLSVKIGTMDTELGTKEKYAIFDKNTQFNSCQLDRLNCDVEPGSDEDGLFDPDKVYTAAKLIWPSMKEIAAASQRRDWFEN